MAAALPPRTITITEFLVLVAIAFVSHAIVLFVLPKMQFLFSPHVMQLMQYGGHGATVNPTHPVIYALYLLPFPAFVGLFLLQAWGRYLFFAFVVVTVLGSFVLGTSISGPPETFFAVVATLVDGAILGFAFLNPPRAGTQPSNPLMQPAGQELPAADQER
jgi:hypothetical protein